MLAILTMGHRCVLPNAIYDANTVFSSSRAGVILGKSDMSLLTIVYFVKPDVLNKQQRLME